jgi:hypothetical protein
LPFLMQSVRSGSPPWAGPEVWYSEFHEAVIAV